MCVCVCVCEWVSEWVSERVREWESDRKEKGRGILDNHPHPYTTHTHTHKHAHVHTHTRASTPCRHYEGPVWAAGPPASLGP